MTTSVSDSRTSLIDTLDTCSGTDIGRRREENQDALGVVLGESLHFYIVADGMGGVQGGAVASKLAIETFAEQFEGVLASDLNCNKVREAIQKSNSAIFDKGNEDTSLSGMGTTFVGIAVTADRMLLFNVGDSRAYRVRNKRILQLTQDHTLVSDLIRSGAITPDQAENHPVSHMLTRSLGPAESVEPDCSVMEDGPAGGDVYLLCSDGLYNLVSDREILRVLTGKGLEEAKDELIRLANDRGGTDNITVVLLRVGDDYPVDAEQFTQSEASIGFDESDTVELEIDLNGHIRDKNTGQEFSIPDQEEETVVEDLIDSPVIEEGVSISNVQKSTQQRFGEKSEAIDEQTEHQEDPEEGVNQDVNAEAPPSNDEVQPGSSYTASEQDEEVSEFGTRRRLSTGMMIVGGVVALFILAGLLFSGSSQIPQEAQTLSSEQNIESSTLIPDFTPPEAGPDGETKELGTPTGNTAPKQEDENGIQDIEASKDADQGPSNEQQPSLGKIEENRPVVTGVPGLSDFEGLSFPEVQGIRARKEKLQSDIARIEKRLQAFDVPYSGNLAEVLVTTSRERQALEEKLEQLQLQIDESTRDLAKWYSLQKSMATGKKSMRLVEQTAQSSEAVREAKSDFENTTWEYLKQAEALRYSPTDVALQENVKKLISQRKQKQAQMYELVESEVAKAIVDSNETILVLNQKRDQTKTAVKDLLDELDYLKVLMSGSEEERAKLKTSLEIQLLRSQAALEELDRILSD